MVRRSDFLTQGFCSLWWLVAELRLSVGFSSLLYVVAYACFHYGSIPSYKNISYGPALEVIQTHIHCILLVKRGHKANPVISSSEWKIDSISIYNWSLIIKRSCDMGNTVAVALESQTTTQCHSSFEQFLSHLEKMTMIYHKNKFLKIYQLITLFLLFF